MRNQERNVNQGQRYSNNKLKTNQAIKKSRKNLNSAEQINKKRNKDKCKLVISHLPMNVTNNDLYTLFSQFGSLKKCKIDFDDQGRSYRTYNVFKYYKLKKIPELKIYIKFLYD